MSRSPQARTIESLESQGYLVDVTERNIPRAKTTKDLFGFIDLVALDAAQKVAIGFGEDVLMGNRGCLGIQVTSGANHSTRRKKILGPCAENALRWLQAGNRIEVRSWSKLKAGWTERVEEITLDDFRP